MDRVVRRLTPVDAPETMSAMENGRMMVARVEAGWYVLCRSLELGRKPLGRTLFGTPIVLFRAEDGSVGALLDRCAHRNIPLSLGRADGKGIECCYHGWQFDAKGNRTKVPGLMGRDEPRPEMVPYHAAREQDGFVWVHGAPGVEPATAPYKLPEIDEPGYTTVRREVDAEASLHATIENALDVPHTAFLHRGLFRGKGKRNEIRVVVTRAPESVQAEYIGEPRPAGLVGKMLSPSGGIVTHYDRFLLPSIAQVEYRLGEENHIVVTSLCTPVDDFRTRIHAAITFRLRLPGWLVKLVLSPVGMRIFRQDARILREQTAALRRFGGAHFASTELDVLGWQIWRLLRRAQKGAPDGDHEPDETWRREIRMSV